MEVAAERGAARAAPRRRPPGWAVASALVALVVAGPLAALPLSFLVEPERVRGRRRRRCSARRCARAWCSALGVGAGTLLLGGSLAALVSFYDFPGRRWLDWALVLPLAMPAYVLVFVLLGQYDEASPLQSALRALLGDGFQLPQVRSTLGTIVVLTLVLYPYVYILGRGAFLEQSRDTMEAARTLGMSHARAVVRVALPLARPALAAGAALAVMEALADFGAVNLLNYRAMTDAIYRVWYGAFDQAAALQLATILLSLTLALIALERLLRGRARYHGALARGEAVVPRRLHGPRAALADRAAVAAAGARAGRAGGPARGLGGGSMGEGAALGDLLARRAHEPGAGGHRRAAGGGRRDRRSSTAAARARRALGAVAARLGALGYAVPGTVVAVAVYTPLAWLDRRIVDGGRELLGVDLGLLFTGTILGLVVAYVVRFQALAFFSVDSRMRRVDPALDDAARSLGADANRVLADVHLPLLWPGIVTAALLVFVEVMKELPATALLRPLGGDTLAVAVWEATRDSRFEVAALPALVIVAVGLVPVVLAIRSSRGGPRAR